MNECNICGGRKNKIFNHNILNKYEIDYFVCNNCKAIQTEDPFWLTEAYSEAITNTDTGIVVRNLNLSEITSKVIYYLFDKNLLFVDYGGGYGLFTRIMRDKGFDFYWEDPYSNNLFAKGFELNTKVSGATAFEVFEHEYYPDKIIDTIFNKYQSEFLIFSTLLYHNDVPSTDWWYYSFESGQHITIYNYMTLEIIAKKHNLNLYSNGINYHILSKNKINPILFKILNSRIGKFFKVKMNSKTMIDHNYIKSQKQ